MFHLGGRNNELIILVGWIKFHELGCSWFNSQWPTAPFNMFLTRVDAFSGVLSLAQPKAQRCNRVLTINQDTIIVLQQIQRIDIYRQANAIRTMTT